MKFEKVSYEQFMKHEDNTMQRGMYEYEKLSLPARKTKESAGYDFVSPVNVTIPAGEKRVIPSGIKAQIDDGHVMFLFIRSHLAIDLEIELQTSVSVIDADYYDNEKNEGHIMIPVKNESQRPVFIAAGERIAQGVIIPFCKINGDSVTEKRTGGIGSTGDK